MLVVVLSLGCTALLQSNDVLPIWITVTDEDLQGGRGQDPCSEDATNKDYPWL